MNDIFKIILIGVLIGLIFCIPLVQIWALNTLFPLLSIPYGFLQYISMMVMNVTFFSKVQTKVSK